VGQRFAVGVVTVSSAEVVPWSPDLHVPERPSWRCVDDGTQWPCPVARRRLWAAAGDRPVVVAERMAVSMGQARTELVGLSAAQLHERFVGWIAAGPMAPQVVFRLMGTDPGA